LPVSRSSRKLQREHLTDCQDFVRLTAMRTRPRHGQPCALCAGTLLHGPEQRGAQPGRVCDLPQARLPPPRHQQVRTTFASASTLMRSHLFLSETVCEPRALLPCVTVLPSAACQCCLVRHEFHTATTSMAYGCSSHRCNASMRILAPRRWPRRELMRFTVFHQAGEVNAP